MNANDQQRENRLKLVEDHIGRSLAQSELSGELKAAKSYGKPLDLGEGYEETPPDLRMGFKILKDAGYTPPEIELMQEIAGLKRSLETAGMTESQSATLARLIDLRQKLAFQMERLNRRS